MPVDHSASLTGLEFAIDGLLTVRNLTEQAYDKWADSVSLVIESLRRAGGGGRSPLLIGVAEALEDALIGAQTSEAMGSEGKYLG